MNRRISSRSLAKIGVAVVAAGLVLGSAVPASAGNLTVWDRASFTGTKLADTSVASAVVDVSDNRTRSTKNITSFGYSARNSIGLGSVEVTYFPSGYQLSSYGSANDTVDHFDRVG